jgi:hypothetical protein
MLTPERIAALPLVLSGPVLRRVDDDSVSVWVALSDARQVTLQVFDIESPSEITLIGSGDASTTRLGPHLHLLVVTASLTTNRWGRLHGYNLLFNTTGSSQVPTPGDGSDLFAPGVLTRGLDAAESHAQALGMLAYDPALPLPTFAMAPADVRSLHVVHASCRHPTHEGVDATFALDVMIGANLSDPTARPHILVLTGDQIYADDSGPGLLMLANDIGDALLGWSEVLPGINQTGQELLLEKRGPLMKPYVGVVQEPDYQVFSLGEYIGLYLLSWSTVLWPTDDFPPIGSSDYQKLQAYFSTVPYVRRALANIPTYMVFDDHETSDDWSLVRDWQLRVYNKPLGNRLVTNALVSFAFFQAWGNNPQGSPASWDALVSHVQSWMTSSGTDTAALGIASSLLGVPPLDALSDVPVDFGARRRVPVVIDGNDVAQLPFHATVTGPGFELVLTDQRMSRSFPRDDKHGRADLLGPAGLEDQLPSDATPPELTIVVSSSVVVPLPLPFLVKLGGWVMRYWRWFWGQVDWQYARVYDIDDLDAWAIQTAGFEHLIARVAQRTSPSASPRTGKIVILAGDVHVGYTARLHYRADRPLDAVADAPCEAVFAHFTSSPLKNEDAWKRRFHRYGYKFPELDDSLPAPRHRFGWNGPAQADVDHGAVTSESFWRGDDGQPLDRRVSVLALEQLPGSSGWTERPDWRYRVDYLLAEPTPGVDVHVSLPGEGAPLGEWVDTAGKYRDYATRWGAGKEVVGRSHLGAVTFEGPAAGEIAAATQTSWWRLVDEAAPEPLAQHRVTFATDDPQLPLQIWYWAEGEP